MTVLTGKCLCEKIAYEINGELGTIVNCHCSKCRRWHGSAFRTRASVKSEYFRWTRGEQYISRYHSSERIIKTFCSCCGSNLISILEDNPSYIGLPLGGLEQDPGNRPIMNIFADSKAPWYEITDDLPCFNQWPEGGPDAVRANNKKQ